jgi:hypothetical protein
MRLKSRSTINVSGTTEDSTLIKNATEIIIDHGKERYKNGLRPN